MQNKYVGDIGDFGKFGLLRHLFKDTHWKLGVVWYLFPDENEGKLTDYLQDKHFDYSCDPELYAKLRDVVDTERSVSTIEKAGVLPRGSVFFTDIVDFSSRRTKRARLEDRDEWLERAKDKLAECNAIFLDPDNGLEIGSCPKESKKKSGKYAYYDEVAALFKGKKICVIYQHFDRQGRYERQIMRRIELLREWVDPSGAIFGIRFKRYSPRVYLILTTDASERYVESQIQSFLSSPWNKHWDSVWWVNKPGNLDVSLSYVSPKRF